MNMKLTQKKKLQTNVKTKTERPILHQEDIEKIRYWKFEIDLNYVPKNDRAELIKLTEPENTEEYKKVNDYFRMYMPNSEKVSSLTSSITGRSSNIINRITAIWKIINPKLRKKWNDHYEFVKEANKDNPSLQLTRLLWHGSGGTKPSEIYEDDRFGWKINYSSQNNLWGNGLYFGEDVHYCHKYVYRTPEGRRQIFLAEVIVGDDIISLENNSLREPLKKEDGISRYDSVCGIRHDKSWIWVVYVSGTAYPAYLVEYED